MNVYDILTERGFIEQSTHAEEVRELLGKEKLTFYIGFDPTADSLTAGGFVQIMTLMHMQRAGHIPVCLMGGGTGMIGDPSDKSDMRKMMTVEEINHNIDRFKEQFARFIDFSDGKAIMANNADWLLNLNYVDFLREVGVHFSVNRMLTADCYKSRYERGLTFFELNYMIMQSYDFLELNRRYGCKLQMGGNDQWSNIIGGVELIRRIGAGEAFGITTSLLTTSDGIKMGKTLKGAVWLDANKTSPYEFFQYWRNVDDADVNKCLRLLTFIPMDEVNRLSALEGSEINKAKEILAFEVTKLVHGEEEATKALEAARALFAGGADSENIPTSEFGSDLFESGLGIIDLLDQAKLIPTRSEGRRLIQQGGIKINDATISDMNHVVKASDFTDGSLMIQKGKKVYHRIKLS